jgi:hypothetical protein
MARCRRDGPFRRLVSRFRRRRPEPHCGDWADDGPPAPGVREPRRPAPPNLSGAAALPLPE